MIPVIFILALFAGAAQAGKRGLAWPWYNKPLNPALFNTAGHQVVAIYDWETYAPPSTSSNGGPDGGLGFIGTQATRGTDPKSSSPVSKLAQLQKEQKWATVFTLNEPDVPGTLNTVSPADAAAWYKQWINPLPVKKAFPAITSSTSSGQGLDWLAKFFAACDGKCSGDYINLHWYGQNFAQFKSHVTNARKKYPNRQIVITEFALQKPAGGQAAQIAFFKEAFAWLDSQSYIQLYFPFVATSPNLLTSQGGGASDFVGTGSCLFNNDGTISAVGKLLLA